MNMENLPPGVDEYQLQLFFENPFNGGGRVARVECFPEESSALVEFCDSKGRCLSRPPQAQPVWLAIPAVT